TRSTVSKVFLRVYSLFIATTLGLPAVAVSESLPQGVLPLAITPAMIQEASKVTQLPTSRGSSSVVHIGAHADDLAYVPPRNSEQIPNGCAQNPGALCYDYRNGGAVYKPMRSLLPDLPGMTPQNLSIRRNKVVAQYSFK
ncbi:MAG: hypothetical protein ABI583_06505, partial [Betaproteobacteria bacterium]